MAALPMVGDTIDGKYVVVRQIGVGGMGTVYRVRTDKGEEVALKVCTDLDVESKRRFDREVRVMQSVKNEHVIHIIDANLSCDPAYYTMPLASGSLEDELLSLNSNFDEVLNVFEQACQGIFALHTAGIIHRDIKPGNMLRMADDTVAVSDMGLSRLEHRDTTILTQTFAVMGTVAFAAPEQLGGFRDADIKTDICQLGKSLYYLITGKPPVVMDYNLLPSGLGYIVQKATRTNPTERYGTVAELLDAVTLFKNSQSPAATLRERYEGLIQSANSLLQQGIYETTTLCSIMDCLIEAKVANSNDFLELFDKIPLTLLRLFEHTSIDTTVLILEGYCDALEKYVNDHSYSYAEEVAKRMELLFGDSADGHIRALAMKAVLISAVERWRFSAMDSFIAMLKKVKPTEVVQVADVIQNQKTRYKLIADKVPRNELAPALLAAHDAALA